MKNLFLLALLTVVALGCKTYESEDGKVPEAILDLAMNYTGDFYGQFNGRKGFLKISIEDRVATVQFEDREGNRRDLIKDDCASDVGALLKFRGDGNGDRARLKWAEFEFSSGRCEWRGDDIRFTFVSKDQIEVKVLKDIVPDMVCRTIPNDNFDPPCIPGFSYDYRRGSFIRFE